ncbi:MAG TPA: hypothetical protein VMT53_17270 [Terriglobales bacterium]|nr:hypothetical protein [Terriglobales bacterium]
MLTCVMLLAALLQLPGTYTQAPSSSQDDSRQESIAVVAQNTDLHSDGNVHSHSGTPPWSLAGEATIPTTAPIPATTGTPGIFTVETGDILGKGVFTVSAYSNKLGRAPGSVTMLAGGLSVAAGLTNKLTVFAQFEPYRHLHIGEPSQLSLRQPAGCAHDVFQAPIYCGLNPGPPNNSWKGPAAGYVADFPLAAYNKTDYGPVTLGLKANFWSETRGDPLSVSMRFSFIIPTESSATELAKFGAQSGTLNYSFTLGLSRTLSRELVMANNVTYLVTRNPHVGGQSLLTPGDQIIFGQGFIFRPQHRLQFLMEYTGVLGQEGHGFGLISIDTENTSLGPSDPVDGVWGVRWYFRKTAALDVGYRYMLNLHQLNDRSGFNIKISKTFGWPRL